MEINKINNKNLKKVFNYIKKIKPYFTEEDIYIKYLTRSENYIIIGGLLVEFNKIEKLRVVEDEEIFPFIQIMGDGFIFTKIIK